jgi:hypothetical protein
MTTPTLAKLAPRAVLVCLGFASSFVLAAGAGKPATAPAASPASPHSLPLPLPLTLADIMRASIEIPADGIWAAQGADKLTEEDWQLVDEDAVNLIAASTFVASGGTGKNDRKWVANADWQSWARDLQKTAIEVRAAAKAQDQKKMAAAADHLQEICEACHTKYRPQTPSDGISRYPFYPKRELPK